MQLSEVRISENGGSQGIRRMPAGSGITCIKTRPARDAMFPVYRLQSRIGRADHETRDPLMASTETGEPDRWTFVFNHLGQEYVFNSDEPNDTFGTFFSSIIAGKESELLSARLDFSALSDAGISDDERRMRLSELRLRFLISRCAVWNEDGSKGTLALAHGAYDAALTRLKEAEGGIVSEKDLLSQISGLEQKFSRLKSRARQLADEQKTNFLLSVKSEYETLLALRRELKDTEQRDGVYGARITNLGHDITVHELADLTAMRSRVGELAEAVEDLQAKLGDIEREKKAAERRRILLRREMAELFQKREDLLNRVPGDQAMNRQAAPDRPDRAETGRSAFDGRRRPDRAFSPRDAGDAHFPTSRHLVILMGLLFISVGLLLLAVRQSAGLLFLICGAVAAATGLLFPAVLPWLQRLRKLRPEGTATSGNCIDDAVRQLDDALQEKAQDDRALTERIQTQEDLLSSESGHLNAVSLDYSQLSRRLLREVKPYAGPSQLEEIDDILDTLMRQRDTSEHYNERVADLLRRIADLKHGRSDDEMEREYEKVCHQLYGDSGISVSGNHSLSGGNPTSEIFYDAERANAVNLERSETEREMDETAAAIRTARERLSRGEDSRLLLDGMKRKVQTFHESIVGLSDDVLRFDSAVLFLDALLLRWDEISFTALMRRTLDFLGRLTGRRVGTLHPVASAPFPKKGMRVPGMRADIAGTELEERMPKDNALFSEASTGLSYLAFRLALADLEVMTGRETGTPLLLLEPALPKDSLSREWLLDTLEEWTLETGRQVICITSSSDVPDLAALRNLAVFLP